MCVYMHLCTQVKVCSACFSALTMTCLLFCCWPWWLKVIDCNLQFMHTYAHTFNVFLRFWVLKLDKKVMQMFSEAVKTPSPHSPLNRCVVACMKLWQCYWLSGLQASLPPGPIDSLVWVNPMVQWVCEFSIHMHPQQQSQSIISILPPPMIVSANSFHLFSYHFL